MHFRLICSDCEDVIAQCRCMWHLKTEKRGMCKKCDEKRKEQEKKDGK